MFLSSGFCQYIVCFFVWSFRLFASWFIEISFILPPPPRDRRDDRDRRDRDRDYDRRRRDDRDIKWGGGVSYVWWGLLIKFFVILRVCVGECWLFDMMLKKKKKKKKLIMIGIIKNTECLGWWWCVLFLKLFPCLFPIICPNNNDFGRDDRYERRDRDRRYR